MTFRKIISVVIITALFPLVAFSQKDKKSTVKDTREYVDLGLPSGTLWATCNIGASKPLIAKYTGDEKDAKSVFDYYSKAVSKMLNSQAKEDYDEKVKYWEEDTTFTDEQRKEFKESITPWDYTMEVSKTFEDSIYIVFNDTEYSYLGGAHGGVFGFGAVTFRFSDGSKVNGFLKDNVVKAMQPLLNKGLKEYFNENADEKITTDKQLMENLQLSDENANLIPLPSWMPCPDDKGKGLVFTYQQYEIACYAVGMPSFVLTWEELKPFLKDDILEDLNIK